MGKLYPGESYTYHLMLGKVSKIGCPENMEKRKDQIDISQKSVKPLMTVFEKNVERCVHILLVDFWAYPGNLGNELFLLDEETKMYVGEVVELLCWTLLSSFKFGMIFNRITSNILVHTLYFKVLFNINNIDNINSFSNLKTRLLIDQLILVKCND